MERLLNKKLLIYSKHVDNLFYFFCKLSLSHEILEAFKLET